MKKIFLLFLVLINLKMIAQVPQGINYQSVVRGTDGNPLANESVTLQFNYVDKSDNSIDYIESFPTTTDEFGVVNFVLGTGTNQTNTFAALDWSKHFRLDIFVNLGSGFTVLGSQDLTSVPYALNAAHAESVDLTLDELTDVNTAGAADGDVLMFDGTGWVPAQGSGGPGFGLPFLANDPNLLSFGVTNTSALGGTAIYGQTTTNSANASGIKGQATGNAGRGVYGTATGTNAFAVYGENTQGTAIKGTTNGAGSNGVHGVSDNAAGTGVRGESNAGTGVLAYSTSGTALNASSINGDAINANSMSGYALTTSGNVRIAGGNTNPGAGKVLTSDAQGNATWQASGATPKIAFRAENPSVAVPDEVDTKVEFSSEAYDVGNGFSPHAGSVTPNSSTFVAPITGVYHFDALIVLQNTEDFFNFDPFFASFEIIAESPNGTFKVISIDQPSINSNTAFEEFTADASCDAHLTAGSKVYVRIYQDNDQASAEIPVVSSFFCGHLVFAN